MRIYNTLKRKKEVFEPIVPGEVKLYSCGPTVYNYIHVGNARPLVVFDTLRRYLEYSGYKVKFAVNFTDIDDKIINKANEENVSTEEIVERYIAAFKEDAKALNFYDNPVIHPRATEYISHMIEFIEGLLDKGAAYEVNGDVYFDISKAKGYGKLSGKNVDDLESGARVDINEQKKNPLDFVLWKNKKPREPFWSAPWGEGRPGWHLECSVMNREIFGDTIDIHAGGEDLQFPHHENETAQSETLTGKTFANYWMHNGMMNVDGVKMSKSLNNFFLVKDVRKIYDGEVLRFLLLSVHYRSPLNYSKETMDSSKAGLERLYNAKGRLEFLIEKSEDKESDSELISEISKLKDKFKAVMDDDLNTADGISVLFEMARFFNSKLGVEVGRNTLEYALTSFLELGGVLGLLSRSEEGVDEEILKLIEERNEAKKRKDFKSADEIRAELLDKGIVLEDTREGVKWRRI